MKNLSPQVLTSLNTMTFTGLSLVISVVLGLSMCRRSGWHRLIPNSEVQV